MTIYTVVPVDEISSDMFESAVQKHADDLRKSLDNSLAIFKFHGETPECFSGYPQYSHAEIIEIMKTPAWTEEQ